MEVYDANQKRTNAYSRRKVVVPHMSSSNSGGDVVYLLGKSIQRAIYGEVRRAHVMKRVMSCNPNEADDCLPAYAMTGEVRAIKCLDWSMVKQNDELHLRSEDALRELCAMQFFEKSVPREARRYVMTVEDALCDGEHLYMVMPFMDSGELFERVQSMAKGRFTEMESRYWMRQIVEGLHALHSCGISHRDLSLENILIDGKYCKIIDFGMALRVPAHGKILPQGTCGKIFYMSPEVYQNKKVFDAFKTDVWAIGVILFMMIVGSAPFEKPDRSDECFRWVVGGKGQLKKLLSMWKVKVSNEAIDLLSRMLCENPSERISLNEVMIHPWTLGIMNTPPTIKYNCLCM